jgi:hypothetical protein
MGKLRFREHLVLANCGNAAAQFNLAVKYGHGIQALKWYTIAAEGGDETAAVARDELLKKMSPVQIGEARRQAQEWVQQKKPTDTVSWRLSIGQKEPELLKKVCALMGSNALIRFSKKRGVAGAVHTLTFDNDIICTDLRQLGLTARKSLTITFPEIPPPLIRHFIRGCWDGDGSVFWSDAPRQPGASFTSGSKEFIEQLVQHLVGLGLPNRTIHKSTRSRNPTYSFRYTGLACATLYRVLYDGVDESMYLARKHDRFRQIADHFSERMLQEVRENQEDMPAVLDLPKQGSA